jgi:hypothetical protein
MNAATQAIPMAPLYYRYLQACLREALQEDQGYSSTAVLTAEAREELEWWKDHFTQWNGRSVIAHNSSLTMPHSVREATTTAASNAGVATCDILDAADWSTPSVFQRFYYKPSKQTGFGRAVLNPVRVDTTTNTH